MKYLFEIKLAGKGQVFLFGMILGIVILGSCEEVGPTIDISEPQEEINHLAQIPEVQEKKLLIMEFSGGNCSNCPNGAAALNNLLDEYGNKIIALTAHMLDENNVLAFPAEGAVQDFRLIENTEHFYGFQGSGIPTAGLDFVKYDNENFILLGLSKWPVYAPQRLAVPAAVNLEGEAHREGDVIKAEISINYTSDVTDGHTIVAVVMEDGIIDHQIMPDLSLNTSYEHRHIIRRYFTISAGSPVAGAMALKPAGTQVIRRFETEIDPQWNLDNCHIVAYVQNATSKEIWQSVEIEVE